MGMTMLIILTTMYVMYAAKKKAFGFQAMLSLLRLLIWLLTQLLFMPLI